MGRMRKGGSIPKENLWIRAGGEKHVIRELLDLNITKRETSWSSNIWPELCIRLFSVNEGRLKKWLYVVWLQDRRGVRTAIKQLTSYVDVQVRKNTQLMSQLNVQMKDQVCLSNSVHSTTTAKGTENEDEERSDESSNHMCDTHLSGGNDNLDDLRESVTKPATAEVNDTDTVAAVPGDGDMDEMKNEVSAGLETDCSTAQPKLIKRKKCFKKGQCNVKKSPVKKTSEKDQYRPIKPGPKSFQINIQKDKWVKIKPGHGLPKLRKSWTHILNTGFQKQNPCCLSFKYQHCRASKSRKTSSPYIKAKAVCMFSTCNAKYFFVLQKKPSKNAKKITFNVSRCGKVAHLCDETRARPASNLKRGKIARAIIGGVSNTFYKRLGKTPSLELLAGNLTRALSKDVLKAVSAEISRSTRLHDDMVMELILTQKIIRESDTGFIFCPGYMQHLQVDPFGVHLYTEQGIAIFIDHLRQCSPVTLFLDATGGVVRRLPNQPKRVLYYALCLSGGGKNKPPIPVSEMITNDHTMANVSFWLMKFLTKVKTITTIKVRQVETDYSWALMQGVLLAFNKQDILGYLEMLLKIIKGSLTKKELKGITVLHLCSAHILKAVSVSFSRKTKDNGLKEFANHCVAHLINSTSLEPAHQFFGHMGQIFGSRLLTHQVEESLEVIKGCIKSKTNLNDSSTQQMKTQPEPPNRAKTVLANSPFRLFFEGGLNKDQSNVHDVNENCEENPYYCPDIIDVLLQDYMGIFPLWSGLMLGDLCRYATDVDSSKVGLSTHTKTRLTNCHVENWFSITKNQILHKERFLRPGTFIRKMHTSLRGRYKEHIMQYGLSDELLSRPLKEKEKHLEHAEEQWGKCSVRAAPKRTKYFHPPNKIPTPVGIRRRFQRRWMKTKKQVSE